MQESSPAERERILLLADHSEQLLHQLRPALPNAEFSCASNLHDGRRLVGEQTFDVVLVDYDLPELRSPEFLAQLRLEDHEPDLLILSRCDDAEVRKRISESRRRYVVNDEGWVDATVVAIRDLLRIRRLETEMVAIRAKLTETNALLDEKNRRLDDFCTTIAHDIRGPLAALMLKVEYILDAYDGELDSKCAGLLQRSHSSCQRLVEMVQGMYEYAKIGSRAVTFFELSLTDLVHEVLYDLSYDDSLDVQAGVGELPRVFGNPGLLRRVFLNLVNNAVKYNDKPEKLINIGCLGYEDRPIGRFARIFVEDNGPGIPEHELKGIFGMFRRGASSRKESDGLGIGLAVVERILELHFGRIDVESTPGRGTRFILSLPVERVELVT